MYRTLLFLTLVACTRRNELVCCETPEECLALGWDSPQPCRAGVCVARECHDYGVCDDDGDCMAPERCVAGGCSVEPMPDAPDEPTEMVPIAGGPFLRGCNGSVETGCPQRTEEIPASTITLSTFYIDKTEVTQLAYSACVTAGACTAPPGWYDPLAQPAHPVTYVSWEQARAYCAWRGLRLPTEAEWEKAARSASGLTYPWGNGSATALCELALYGGCPFGDQTPSPVGTYPMGRSPYTVLDLAGNVWEWIADYWSPTYYSIAPSTNPPGPATGIEEEPGSGAYRRVIRGGGFYTGGDRGLGEQKWLRTAARAYWPDISSHPSIGFRCARSM